MQSYNSCAGACTGDVQDAEVRARENAMFTALTQTFRNDELVRHTERISELKEWQETSLAKLAVLVAELRAHEEASLGTARSR